MTILVLTVVVVAVVVLSYRGRNLGDYYSIAQTLGAFFAISFGFLAARLHEQRNAAQLHDIRWKARIQADPRITEELLCGDGPPGPGITPADIATIRADRESARFLARSLLPISETSVVTFLGIGTCCILVYARPDDHIADLLAFLIVSSVLFSIISMWSGLVTSPRASTETLLGLSVAQFGEALFGYLSMFLGFISIVIAILAGSSDWPSF